MAEHLRVVSKRAGFRRAGLTHPDTPVFHALTALTSIQVDQLLEEPMLIVDQMDPPGYAAPEKFPPKSKGGDKPPAE